MKSKWTHVLSFMLLSAFILIGYASIPPRGSRFDRDKGPLTEEDIMNNPNLTNSEKEFLLAKRNAKIEKDRKNNTVLATVLATDYENNEVSADVKYKGKVFFVEGVIEDIGKDIFDNITVSLVGYDVLGSVTCYIDDVEKVMTLSKGMRIVVRGRCEGTMLGVNMEDCELIEVLETEPEPEEEDAGS